MITTVQSSNPPPCCYPRRFENRVLIKCLFFMSIFKVALLVTVTERAALVPIGECMDEELVKNNHSALRRNTVIQATGLCSVEIESHKAKMLEAGWRRQGELFII